MQTHHKTSCHTHTRTAHKRKNNNLLQMVSRVGVEWRGEPEEEHTRNGEFDVCWIIPQIVFSNRRWLDVNV